MDRSSLLDFADLIFLKVEQQVDAMTLLELYGITRPLHAIPNHPNIRKCIVRHHIQWVNWTTKFFIWTKFTHIPGK